MRLIDRRAHQIIAEYRPGQPLTPSEAAAVIDAFNHLLREREHLIAALARVRRVWPDVRAGLTEFAGILTPPHRKPRQGR